MKAPPQVLLVDDDEVDVEVIIRGFRSNSVHYDVTVAANGMEALDRLHGSRRSAAPRPVCDLARHQYAVDERRRVPTRIAPGLGPPPVHCLCAQHLGPRPGYARRLRSWRRRLCAQDGFERQVGLVRSNAKQLLRDCGIPAYEVSWMILFRWLDRGLACPLRGKAGALPRFLHDSGPLSSSSRPWMRRIGSYARCIKHVVETTVAPAAGTRLHVLQD